LLIQTTETGEWYAEALKPCADGLDSVWEAFGSDEKKAARMAVLRLAAMIGEAMP
jgi:hypothetical protein